MERGGRVGSGLSNEAEGPFRRVKTKIRFFKLKIECKIEEGDSVYVRAVMKFRTDREQKGYSLKGKALTLLKKGEINYSLNNMPTN